MKISLPSFCFIPFIFLTPLAYCSNDLAGLKTAYLVAQDGSRTEIGKIQFTKQGDGYDFT